jgi:aspartate racemase
MKTIGLLGGMSWESSAEYYRIINEEVRDRLGGTHSARSVMVSVDFHEVERLQELGDWAAATALLVESARQCERGGADLLVICTNTMHRMADDVAAAIAIPLLHIADATAQAVADAGLQRIGLLGTRYTMEQDFYRGRLEARHGLDVVVPDEPDRATVHDIIYHELVRGVITDTSRAAYGEVIDRLTSAGADGVILGCTEIELLVTDDLRPVPFFPTTRIHAVAAVDAALER